jgi:copper(I)-binding protein
VLRAITLTAFGLLLSFDAVSLHSEEVVKVTHAWVKPTVPGQSVAGAYLEIRSAVPSKLVAASSPMAGSVEIHSMRLENGVMEMRQLKSLDLPAEQLIKFAPGKMHIMLLDLKRPLKPGDKVPLQLTLLLNNHSKTVVQVQAEVRSTSP